MKIIARRDRVHVETRRVEWTILRDFDGAGRAPCVITDVRARRRPWAQLVADTGPAGPSINDPVRGGLGHVGVIACLPKNGREPDPKNFWNEAWEITTRGPAGAGGYGHADTYVSIVDDHTVKASCQLQVAGQPLMDVAWLYTFGDDDQVDVEISIVPRTVDGLYVKEPKVAFNGLTGYRTLTVTDAAGTTLSRWDLDRHGDPRKHTIQIADPDRRGFHLEAPDWLNLSIELDNVLATWHDQADQAPAMSPNAIRVDGSYGPAGAYCLTPDGHLQGRTELPRWTSPDVCGLAVHGWEGGYGAPDCWNTFRAVSLVPQTMRAAIAFS